MAALGELAVPIGSIRAYKTTELRGNNNEEVLENEKARYAHVQPQPLPMSAPHVTDSSANPAARSGSVEGDRASNASTAVASRSGERSKAGTLKTDALKAMEDGDLLRLFQDGNEQAFYILFDRRHKEIFTHCFRMCGGDAEKANDAFQDTFVKVFTRKDLFKDATNGRAWLYRIATNTCLNQIRYDKRHPKEQLDVSLGAIDPKLQPDFGSEQENLRTELERAITKLPIELREPFLLRELEEFSYEEVAEQLGLTVAACRQRVYRAKQVLREELQEIMTGERKESPKKQRKGWGPFGGRS